MKYLIIGAGLSGSVIARSLAEREKEVIVLDRRSHIGGNMYDYEDAYGVLVQAYGPHTFHTQKRSLFEYMCRFEDWVPYKLVCGAEIDGQFTPTPFNYKTIDLMYDKSYAIELKRRLKGYFKDKKTATVIEVMNANDSYIRNYGRLLFDKDYSLYTAKQWGIPAEKVEPNILKRVPIRLSYDEGYFDDYYQVMPKHSFAIFFENLLRHPNITIHLNHEGLKYLQINCNGKSILVDGQKDNITVIYTGALDEFFGGDMGYLPYRSLQFEWRYDTVQSIQPYPVTAYPQREKYTRITEYNKLPLQQTKGTTYAIESVSYTHLTLPTIA